MVAPLAIASTVQELAKAELTGKVLLLRGDIAREPLMPKNFPFYNPDEHQEIIRILETKNPLGIIAATSRNPEMAGAVYPFPLIEDGDFDIPSVFMTEEEGVRLARLAGDVISLDIQAERIASQGANVIARKGSAAGRRVVFCAHIDSKAGTPGALDNASGVVVLLLLAELLKEYQGRLGIEILAINGEDYYSNPGEVSYLDSIQGKFAEVLLAINLDGVGYRQGSTAYSLYGCPDALAAMIRGTFSAHPELVEGEQWYQGDHMLFVMNQVPALAITSEQAINLLTRIIHTSRDEPELVSSARLVDLARSLHDLLPALESYPK
jgi:aminopeptidase YwaD